MSTPNKIVSRTYFCMECKKGPFTPDNIAEHGCLAPFKIMESIITCTKKPVWRFIDRILSWDISYWLAFTGLVTMNAILIGHIGLSYKECLLEAIGFGFAIPRLLK